VPACAPENKRRARSVVLVLWCTRTFSRGTRRVASHARAARCSQCPALRPVARCERSTQWRDRFQALFSMPLAYPSTLDRRRPGVDVVLRGGALEPEPRVASRNSQAKANANSQREFQADAQRVFLSQAGPRFSPSSSSSWASPFGSTFDFASETTKATLLGRPREKLLSAQLLRRRHLPRGLTRARADRGSSGTASSSRRLPLRAGMNGCRTSSASS
jgi:hypothetical protein